MTDLFDWLREQLANNEVLSGVVGGGLIVSVFTTLMYSLRGLPDQLWDLFKRQFTVTLTIYSSSDTFIWIQQWIADSDLIRNCRRLQLETNEKRSGSSGLDDDGVWLTTMGLGSQLFWHNRRWFLVSSSMEKSEAAEKPFQTIEFRTLGRSQKPLLKLVDDACNARIGFDQSLPVCVWHHHYWKILPGVPRRELNSVYLPQMTKDGLLRDVEWFIDNENWYNVRGVPYRRGYLFSGPPGTGKTTMIMALATHFRRLVYSLNLSAVRNDSTLQEAFWAVPKNGILVIEDIDAAVTNRDDDQKDSGDVPVSDNKGLALSTLLNVIDGISAQEGQVLIMTTNYPDRIDPALIRPGRVDKRIEFDLANVEAIQQMLKRFYPSVNGDVNFPNTVRVSPAKVQSIFMSYPDDRETAIRKIVEASSV